MRTGDNDDDVRDKLEFVLQVYSPKEISFLQIKFLIFFKALKERCNFLVHLVDFKLFFDTKVNVKQIHGVLYFPSHCTPRRRPFI